MHDFPFSPSHTDVSIIHYKCINILYYEYEYEYEFSYIDKIDLRDA